MVLFALSSTVTTRFAQHVISLPWFFLFAVMVAWIGLNLFWVLGSPSRFELRGWRPSASFWTGVVVLLVLLEVVALLIFGVAQFAPYSSLDLPRRALGLQGQMDVDSVYTMAYAPDSQTLLLTGFDGTVTLVSPSTGVVLWRTKADYGAEHVAFSPDGKLVAELLNDGSLVLQHTSDGAVVLRLPQVRGHLLAFSPDSTLVAVAGSGKPARAWRIADGQLLQTVDQAPGEVFPSFGADNRLVVRPLQISYLDGLRTVVLSPDGRVAAQTSYGITISLIDTATGETLQELRRHGEHVNAMAFSADGTLLAESGNDPDTGVRVWRVADGEQVGLYPSKLGASSLAFAPDGHTLVSKEYRQLAFWRLP
jgi:outer membrane protein assembly factor BamB